MCLWFLLLSLCSSSLDTASAQLSKYFWSVSTCLHKISLNVSISASFSLRLWPFWENKKALVYCFMDNYETFPVWFHSTQTNCLCFNKCPNYSQESCDCQLGWVLKWKLTLKEDVEVVEKPLVADVSDSMEPCLRKLDSEPYPESACGKSNSC